MIDIHTHIIPALDDGPADMETSIRMGHIAAAEGTTAIISTSHSAEATSVGHRGMIARLEDVREAWKAAGLNIRLELGVEVYLQPGSLADLQSGRLWTLAGSKYVLVELPYRPWPSFADRTMFELQVAGYFPILAHPERYSAIQDDPNHMYTLAQRGILGQVTAAALLGDHGRSIQQCAETLLRHGLVQFIASDGHGQNNPKRLPVIAAAVEAAGEMVGHAAARAMVVDNPAHIFDDTPLHPTPERAGKSSGPFRGLRRSRS